MVCVFKDGENCKLSEELRDKLPKPCPNSLKCPLFTSVHPNILLKSFFGSRPKLVRTR